MCCGCSWVNTRLGGRDATDPIRSGPLPQRTRHVAVSLTCEVGHWFFPFPERMPRTRFQVQNLVITHFLPAVEAAERRFLTAMMKAILGNRRKSSGVHFRGGRMHEIKII